MTDFASQLFQQATAISKAGAYDALAPMAAKLQKQNEQLIEALELLAKPVLSCLDANGVSADNQGITCTFSLKNAEKIRAALANARGAL